jgi:hypothetical protein
VPQAQDVLQAGRRAQAAAYAVRHPEVVVGAAVDP